MDIKGAKGELRMTLQITRKDTGKVEEVEMVGYADQEQYDQLVKEGFIKDGVIQKEQPNE